MNTFRKLAQILDNSHSRQLLGICSLATTAPQKIKNKFFVLALDTMIRNR